MQNGSGQDAAAARLIFLDPDKDVVQEETITTTIPAGGQTTITNTPALPYSPLGVWAVDYVLLDDDGYAIQDQAIGAAFVVSDPAENIGPDRPWDFWITAPSEYWVRGTTGEFTFHIHNRTDSDRDNVQVRYGFPHHTWETNEWATYGNFDDLVYDVGTVPANDEVTFSVQRPMLTMDRLFGYLYEDGTQQRSTSFQIRPLPAAAQVAVQPAKDSYYVGEPVTVSVTLTNTEPSGYTATARLRAFDPTGVLFDSQEQPFTLGGEGSTDTLVYTLTMPVTPTFGLHTVQMDAVREGQVVGFGQAHFDLPVPHVAVTVQGPDAYRLGQDNTVAFVLENQGGTIVEEGTFDVHLEAPDPSASSGQAGQTLWSASNPFTLDGWQTITFTHAVPFSTALGVYAFDYDVRMRGSLVSRDTEELPAAYAVTRETDKARYASGETMTVTVTVQNIGDFREALDVRLEVPGGAFSQIQTTTPDPDQAVILAYQVPLPITITGGVHPMTVTLTTEVGSSAAKCFQYIILPANLRLSLGTGPYHAGGTLPVVLTNVGGGGTDYTGQVLLRDGSGRLVSWGSTAGTLCSGKADTYPLSLPSDLAEGLYTLRASYTAHPTGQQARLTRIVAVQGLEAELSTATEEQVYQTPLLVGGGITATACVTNTGDFPITNGTLALQGISMLGVSPLAGVVQDSEGRRLTGTWVALDGSQAVWTNLAGEYRFESIGVGNHLFQVERVGYQVYSATHFVAGPQEPLTLTLVPRPAAELSGTVRASGGITIVVGADVHLPPPIRAPPPNPPPPGGGGRGGVAHLRTGGDGTYHFTGLTPGTYTITVTAPGFQDYTATVTLNEGTNTHDVNLTPHASRPPGLACPLPIPSSRPLFDTVGGVITESTTWTLANSPYTLTADVTVASGVTLTIQPGVVVLGRDSARLEVQGHLQAVGLSSQPITFTSSADSGPGEWEGLYFNGGTGHLRHATVRYGGDADRCANIYVVNVTGGEVRIESSQVLSAATYLAYDYGLHVSNGWVVISDTTFAHNGDSISDETLYVYGSSSAVTITGSVVRDNAGKGIALAGGARATVRHSSIHDNGGYQVYNTSATPPDARYNWWGTTTPTSTLFYGDVLTAPWIITETFAGGYFDLAQDTYESNDTFAQATPLDGVGTVTAAFLDPSGDTDVYRLDVNESGTLLAIADATGTPLALQVTLYDVSEDVLATDTGTAGGVVTATTIVSPGLYYVRVAGTGNAQSSSSHLPYHLTMLLADSRSDLVAQTVGEGAVPTISAPSPWTWSPGPARPSPPLLRLV